MRLNRDDYITQSNKFHDWLASERQKMQEPIPDAFYDKSREEHIESEAHALFYPIEMEVLYGMREKWHGKNLQIDSPREETAQSEDRDANDRP